jgi:PAS domain S-box-containing protein
MTPPNATSLTAIRRIRPYALAVGAVAAAFGLALAAELQSVNHLETSLFLMAIAAAVWYGGAGPGALALGLSSLCFNYFFTAPRYSLDLEPVDRIHFVIFILFALLIGWFASTRRRIEQDLQRALDELDTAALRTQQARLLNLTHDTIFVRDMSDVITYWNRGAKEFYGWTAEEVVGKVTSHQLLQTVFPAPLEQINAELLGTGRWEGEIVHTKRDGAQVVVASRWSMERDEQGRPLATLETNNDISERKRAEEEIRELNTELEQRVIERTDELKASNKELEAFAYSISHDLRAPLRHVAGYTELLQKNAVSVLDEKSRRYVLMILESVQKMGDLIDDLLAFSRIGRAETQNTLVSVGEIVNDVIKEVGRETDGRDIVWKIGALPSLHGDRSMLRLALVNLLSNAVKFTRSRRQAEIEIACVDGKKDEIVVFVRDNGVGFDMKYVNKLFGVFQRLHLPETFEGTGIGLATVQRIVARHGGRVWAEGVVDGGATFYLAFPNTHTG